MQAISLNLINFNLIFECEFFLIFLFLYYSHIFYIFAYLICNKDYNVIKLVAASGSLTNTTQLTLFRREINYQKGDYKLEKIKTDGIDELNRGIWTKENVLYSNIVNLMVRQVVYIHPKIKFFFFLSTHVQIKRPAKHMRTGRGSQSNIYIHIYRHGKCMNMMHIKI